MSKYCFGVDVGGTTVKLGLFNKDGDLLEKWEIPTVTQDDGKRILPDIAQSILKVMEGRGMQRDEVEGVGIGVPGPVDGGGTVHGAVNLGWGTFSIKQEMQTMLNMPVEAGNDANVAALGEVWQGGARGYKDVVMVTLGTGVGGGIVMEGSILPGSVGAAGEIGHFHVNDDEQEACNCGNHGCLEQYVSATGVVRLAKRRLADEKAQSTLRGTQVTAKDVWEAVKGLAIVASVVNPEVFVIGGGVSKAGDILIDYIQKNFQKNTFVGCRGALFTLAQLGNDAGIYGAAKMVLG